MSHCLRRNTRASTAQARIRILGLAAAAALWAAALGDARGAASVEPFDYAPGTLGGQDGGSGWSGAWIAPSGGGSIETEDGSLAYSSLVTSGGKMHCKDSSGGTAATVTYRTNAVPFTNGVLYARFLGQNLNDGRRYFGLSFFSNKTERLLLGQGSTYSTWTLNHVDGITNVDAKITNTLVSAVSSANLSLLVLKMELQDGPERVTFWVNPDLSLPEDETTAVGGQSFLTDLDVGQVTRVRIGTGGYNAAAGGNATEHYMDEISMSAESPFPSRPALACSMADGMLTVSWPAQCLGWILQSQTVTPGADLSKWAGTDIPGTDLVTSIDIPIGSDSPMMLFRLRHQ